MSITEQTSETEGRESGLLHERDKVAVRVFATELTPGDGRTVDLRIVPYGERCQANDGLAGLPRGVMYDEEILPGAFDHQLTAAHRVHMNVEHEPGILGVVGHGLNLASRSDGLYGSFRFLETQAGETARALVREGALGGVSFEAKFRKTIRAATGVFQRVKADLVNIALCRDPAYESAIILGLRTEMDDEVILDEELLPIPFDPELADRIAALGIAVPDHLKAHPATDTSAETDTSESAPAEETESTTTEVEVDTP
jgi:HK97 family phage prohead protease